MVNIWDPQPKVLEAVKKLIRPDDRDILDIGPGPNIFPLATEAVDHRDWDCDVPLREMNFNHDQLPKIVYDFIYCRHVLEDIYNPVNLLNQMWWASKRGYIETPSPLHELCKGVDGKAPYRGYHHHKWFIWTENNILNFLPKCSIIEYANIELPQKMDPLYANNYYVWNDNLQWKIWEFEIDMSVYDETYMKAIERSCIKCTEHTNELVEEVNGEKNITFCTS